MEVDNGDGIYVLRRFGLAQLRHSAAAELVPRVDTLLTAAFDPYAAASPLTRNRAPLKYVPL